MSTTSSTTPKSTSSKQSKSQVKKWLTSKINRPNAFPVAALEENLTERHDVKSQLAVLQSERGQLKEEINRQYIELRQARDKSEGYKAAVARENSPDSQSRSSLSLKSAEEEISSLRESIDASELRLCELDSQATALQERIDALGAGCSEQDAKAYLQALKTARNELQRLDELIQSAQSVSTFDESREEMLETLQSAREDALAEIAAGDAKPELLQQIDSQIEELLTDSDGSQADAISQERDKHQTLVGLERRRSATQARYDQLKAQSSEVIEQLVIARVEALSLDYIAHAQAFQQSYQQIQGMAGLLESAVPKTEVCLLPKTWSSAMIPALPLKTFGDAPRLDGVIVPLFSGRLVGEGAARRAAVNEQLEQLEKMGLGELFTQ